MKINDFAKEVSEDEGKKKETDIAQIKEVLKVADTLLGGELYKLIKKADI